MQLLPSHTIALAKQVIRDSLIYETRHERQKIKIAKAYFTLSQNPEISMTETKMHLNSCISLLQNMKKKGYKWAKDISLAYHKRAEIFEDEDKLNAAMQDYLKASEVLSNIDNLNEDNNFLLAECYISIADILMYQDENDTKKSLIESYKYSKKAISCLIKSKSKSSESLACLSYAYQTAGIALSEVDFDKSVINFRQALKIVYNSYLLDASQSIAENYKYLSILYSIKSYQESFNPLVQIYEECSQIYGFLNNLLDSYSSEVIEANILEKIIYHIARISNNPFLDKEILQDIVDGLVYIHVSIENEWLELDQFYINPPKNECLDLLKRAISNLVSIHMKSDQSGAIRTFTSIFNKAYDYHEIALQALDRVSCKVLKFKLKKQELAVL